MTSAEAEAVDALSGAPFGAVNRALDRKLLGGVGTAF